MPRTRRSKQSKAEDLKLHEALVSGLAPEKVAAKFSLSVEEVQAGDRRVLAARAKLSPAEARAEERMLAMRVVRKLALEHFQRSVDAEEVGTKSSIDTATQVQKVERTTHQKQADPLYLRIAIWATAEERQCELPPAPPAPAAKIKRSFGELDELLDEDGLPPWAPSKATKDFGPSPVGGGRMTPLEAWQRARVKHPDYAAFEDTLSEEILGVKIPRFKFGDPKWRNPHQKFDADAPPDTS